MYSDSDFQKFVLALREAKTPSNLYSAWCALPKKYKHIKTVVSLSDYKKQCQLPGTNIRDLQGKKLVVSYFTTDSLYYIDKNIVDETLNRGIVDIHIDNAILMDTNVVSYIRTYMRKEKFNTDQAEIVNLLHQLIEEDSNMDCNFYLIENSSKIINECDEYGRKSKEEFWHNICPKIKENLIAVHQFLSIDNERFRRTNNDSPTITDKEAEEKAKDHAYGFYCSEDGFKMLQETKKKLILFELMIYKMITIYFESKESVNKKVSKFLKFLIEDLHIYFEREMYMAVKYFKEGRKLKFFEKVDKRKDIAADILKKKVANIAWDLMIPRIGEWFLGISSYQTYFIPYFITRDRGLVESLNSFRAKACIYDVQTRNVMTISETDTEGEITALIADDILENYFSQKKLTARYANKKKDLCELESLLVEVEKECLNVLRN